MNNQTHTLPHINSTNILDRSQSKNNESVNNFSCRLDSTQSLINIFQTIHFDKNQPAIFTITNAGLKFTVEKTKSLQARAYVKAALFRDYKLLPKKDTTAMEFTIDLTSVIDCLRIFGESSRLELSYVEGEVLNFVLECEGVVTTCSIKTLTDAEPLDFDFGSSPIMNRVALRSQYLKDLFSEIEVPGSNIVTVLMSPSKPFFSFSVSGDSSSVEVSYPINDSDICPLFESKEEMIRSYRLNLVRHAARALIKADQTNFRMNNRGMLSIQHYVPTNNITSYVEFILLPEEE